MITVIYIISSFSQRYFGEKMTIQIFDQELSKNIKINEHPSSTNVELNKKNTNLFFKYITERHSMYKKRFIQNQPAPWTNDEILRKYKFTNVFRDLDPGTIYVIEKIIPNCNSVKELIFNTIIYRLYNKIATFDFFGIQNPDNFNQKTFEKKLRQIKELRKTVFTNAFTVSSYHWINPDKDKISNTSTLIKVISNDIDRIADNISKKKESLFTYKTLLKIKGIGKFLAYQISVDLGYYDKDIFNEDKYVVAGPGCTRGIDYIFKSKGILNYEECIFYIRDIQNEEFQKIDVHPTEIFSDRKSKEINVMAIENCFCEISKYLKAFYGEGRPRNKFIHKNALIQYF